MARRVEPVPVHSGEQVLDLLSRLADALAGTGPALLPLGEDDPRSENIAAALRAGDELLPGEDDTADPTVLVMPTSGSTGLPKGVLLSAGQLAASAAATESRLGGPGTWLLALPAQHIAGMQVLLRATSAGSAPIVMPGGTPFTAADFVTRSRLLPGPRRYVSLVPTQLARLVADRTVAAEIADIYDAILVGGAATPPELLAAAREAGLPVVTTYGMTETCGGCVYDGIPLDGVRAAVDPAGAVTLSGPMVARGYRCLPEHPAFAAPGTFVTSDAGTVAMGPDSRQRVDILGRMDDLIVTGGVNVAPELVEAAIKALPNIADALVVGVPDPRWGQAVAALVVPAADEPITVRQLRAALTELPREHRPQRILIVPRIGLLPSGKPDRTAARGMFD